MRGALSGPEGDAARRLSVVIAADVAGYTRLMANDEDATVRTWWEAREQVIDPTIAEHRGRIVKLTGDGFLAEFSSVQDAMKCAVDMQKAFALRNAALPAERRMTFRMGVNLGDVIADREDIYGDGVNLAARLEGLAEPGSICVSADVYNQIHGKLGLLFDDLGEQQLKNIPEPIHAYRWRRTDRPAEAGPVQPSTPSVGPTLAVLPFTNIGNNPEQEYFADGMADDLITALSRIRWFSVIARNSTFAYKDQSPDIREVARELDARYVLEGSIRAVGKRIRINAQLIDGCDGKHIWAKRYDRELEDIFDVQDEITQAIVGELEPEMSRAERERALRKSHGSLDAWGLYQRGMSYLYRRGRDDLDQARLLFEQARELDPKFGPPHAALAQCHYYYLFFGWMHPCVDHEGRALAAARAAVDLSDDAAAGLVALATAHIIGREHDEAIHHLNAALETNPADAVAHRWKGVALIWSGKSEEGITYLENSLRLSPHDPYAGRTMARMAEAYLFLGDYDRAAEWARSALREPSTQFWANAVLTSTLGLRGETDAARAAKDELLKRWPAFTCSFARKTLPTIDQEDLAIYLQGLAKAGVPD